ncbi:MAG: exonuclease SbcCD subunit D C-terminal domain-containing protein [Bacteroidaceae bacterium]|nr:exonuclease SbcCD subunit D C-terminal domain-containing protein [Bacteroidaceae bacterium]
MNIIHTADWHLGQTFFGYERYREHEVFLNWICDVIKEREIDLLLIAGDIFDSPNPSAEAQRMFYSFLTKITNENRGLQIILTAGNHDSAARLEAPNSLLGVFNTTVSGVVHYKNGEIDYERMIVPLKKGGCCLAVPYLRLSDLPEAENYSEGVALLYNELYRRAKEMGYSPVVAMGHLQASGAEVSVGDSSEYAIIGGMEGIDAQFANEGIIYTALGHLHREQQVHKRANVRYSGAPLPMSFAEKRNSQSVTQIIIDDGGCCDISLIPFDVPVKLKSVPSKAAPIEDVIRALAELPDGNINENSPFLEVNVLVKTVDPTLRQQIEDALVGKSIRLARIVATSTAIENGEQSAPMTYDDFKCKNPIEIMQEIYRKRCDGEEMTEELLEKLNEVIKEIQNEDIGNKGM